MLKVTTIQKIVGKFFKFRPSWSKRLENVPVDKRFLCNGNVFTNIDCFISHFLLQFQTRYTALDILAYDPCTSKKLLIGYI